MNTFNKKAILSVLLLSSFTMPAVSGSLSFLPKPIRNEIKIAKNHLPDIIRGKMLNTVGTVITTILFEKLIEAPACAIFNVIKNIFVKEEPKTVVVSKEELVTLAGELEKLEQEAKSIEVSKEKLDNLKARIEQLKKLEEIAKKTNEVAASGNQDANK